MVTMSMSRMSSVDYLTGHIAAGDGSPQNSGSPMTRYYAADGYPPGTWIGSGLAALGDGGLESGSEVTEEQLRSLFEAGCDPVTGVKIGNASSAYSTRAKRIERRVTGLSEALPEPARTAAIRQIIRDEQDTLTCRIVITSVHLDGIELVASLPQTGVMPRPT